MAEARRCDVLVIGAGPGGGSAALHASRLGLSTIIVEADPLTGLANKVERFIYGGVLNH